MDASMRSLINEIVRRIVDVAAPEQVILFGSQVEGNARADSDVDLLVIEAEPFGRNRSRLAEIGRIERALRGVPVATDVLVYSRDEVEYLRDAAHHIVFQALTAGEVVYARS